MGRAFQNRKESMAKTADAKTKVYSKYGREKPETHITY